MSEGFYPKNVQKENSLREIMLTELFSDVIVIFITFVCIYLFIL